LKQRVDLNTQRNKRKKHENPDQFCRYAYIPRWLHHQYPLVHHFIRFDIGRCILFLTFTSNIPSTATLGLLTNYQDVELICHEDPLDEIWLHNLSPPTPFLFPHCTDRTRMNALRSEGPGIWNPPGWPS
jgi:hypothetical protein